jgi:hypothetical protein
VGKIVAAEPSTENHWGEPSVGNRSTDRAKHARSEEAPLASRNRCVADNDARRWISQNHRQHEYGHDPADLHNVIDDRRRLRARTSSLHDAHLCEPPLHQGGACPMYWHPSSGKLSGPTNSSLDELISMRAPVTLKSSSKSTTRSKR